MATHLLFTWIWPSASLHVLLAIYVLLLGPCFCKIIIIIYPGTLELLADGSEGQGLFTVYTATAHVFPELVFTN